MSERDQIVVLADISPSMLTIDGGSNERKTRFDLLKLALANIPQGVKIIQFSDHAQLVSNAAEVAMNMGEGGTALHLAIDAAARFSPVRTIIVSDGEPDSEPLASAAIEKLTGIVDVIFCGDPKNERAKTFLESLAREGAGGFYQTGDQVDVCKQLPAVIAGLLGPKA